MIIRTRKLQPTDRAGVRIRARIENSGEQLTVAYDFSASDPHAVVAERLAGGPVRFVRNTTMGNVYRKVEA